MPSGSRARWARIINSFRDRGGEIFCGNGKKELHSPPSQEYRIHVPTNVRHANESPIGARHMPAQRVGLERDRNPPRNYPSHKRVADVHAKSQPGNVSCNLFA